jgi:8-hydroxy-5-deazaflavin:NADPH oxidoreductase
MENDMTCSRREFLQLTTSVGAAWVVGVRLSAQGGGTVPQTKKPMKIGIIGSGQQGGSVGLRWALAGHEVLFSSRNPGELKDLVSQAGPRARAGLPQEAATFGDVILIAVPYAALPQIGKDYGPSMKNKVVIDCGNPREDRDGTMAVDAAAKGTGVASADFLPGVRLVRAFNALSFQQVRSQAFRAGERLGIPIAGNDRAAVAVTVQLVEDAGFDPVVVGGLDRAKEFDRGTAVYVKGLTARQIREALKLPAK